MSLPTMQLVELAGRPAVLKSAPPGPAADRLAREAELLEEARHPSVVEVLAADPLPGGGFELALAYAGSRTAADLRPPVAQAVAIGAALAAAVADLHALGIRHGRIRPDHVVLDATGRPVLCGFGDAGRAGERGAPAPADDVAGVGEVLRALVGTETDAEPIPEQRFVRRPWTGATSRALLTLADQATDDVPARRPTAATLAASIGTLAPPAPREGPRRRVPTPVLVAGALVVAVFLASAAVGAGGLGAPPAPTAAPAEGAPAGAPAPVVDAAEPIVRLAPVEAVDGRVVERDGTRYEVGAPGDVLAVGDWDCDGHATVAAVRPATGEVFVFDRWATEGADVVVPPTAVVPGAVRPDAADGCGALAVVAADGTRTEVAL